MQRYEQFLNAVTDEKRARPYRIFPRQLDEKYLNKNSQGQLIEQDIPLNTDLYANAEFAVEGTNYELAEPDENSITFTNKKGSSKNSRHSPMYMGYNVRGNRRIITPVNYIVQDNRTGEITKVSFPSVNAKEAFINHFFGREMTPELEKKVINVHEWFYEELTSQPELQEKLEKFLDSREYNDELKGLVRENAKLAYYTEEFARKIIEGKLDSFESKEDEKEFIDLLYLSGIIAVQIGPEGNITMVHNEVPNVRIAYTVKDEISDELLIRSTRNRMDFKNAPESVKTKGPKYRDSPQCRDIVTKRDLNTKIYHHFKLGDVEGNELVITEGEFKALVTELLEGSTTLSIPGITDIGYTLAKEIVGAGPSKVTVVLDRDPQASSDLNPHNTSDSMGASWLLGKLIEDETESQKADIDVRVAYLPDVFNGDKVGTDDLALSEGGLSKYKQTLEEGMKPNDFAKHYNIDAELVETNYLKRTLEAAYNRKNIEIYRGGEPLAPELVKDLDKLRGTLQNIQSKILGHEYLRESLAQPRKGLNMIHQNERGDNVHIVTQNNGEISARYLNTSMAYYELNFENLQPKKDREEGSALEGLFSARKSYESLGIKSYDFVKYLNGKEDEIKDKRFAKRLNAGIKVLDLNEDQVEQLKTSASLLSTTLAAGLFTTIYPPSSYQYEINVDIFNQDGDSLRKVTQIPLLFRKKDGKNLGAVRAIISPPSIDKDMELSHAVQEQNYRYNKIGAMKPSGQRPKLSAKRRLIIDTINDIPNRAKKVDEFFASSIFDEKTLERLVTNTYEGKYGITDFEKLFDYAMADIKEGLVISKTQNNFIGFLINRKLASFAKDLGLIEKAKSQDYLQVTDLLSEVFRPSELQQGILDNTFKTLGAMGFSQQFILENNLLILSPEDVVGLMDRFEEEGLLNAAEQAGILGRDEKGKIQPRFEGEVFLTRKMLRGKPPQIIVAPINEVDMKKLPDCKGVFSNIDSIYEHTNAFSADDYLYNEKTLNYIEGKPLIITSNPLEAMLVMNSGYRGKANVVGLDGDFKITDRQIEKIIEAGPSSIHFLSSGLQIESNLSFSLDVPENIRDIAKIENKFLVKDDSHSTKELASAQDVINGSKKPKETRIPIYVFHSQEPLTAIKHEDLWLDSLTDKKNNVTASIKLRHYLTDAGYSSKLTKLIDGFEGTINTFANHVQFNSGKNYVSGGGKLISEDEQQTFVDVIKGKFSELSSYMQNKGYVMPDYAKSLDVYLQKKLGLESPISIDEIVDRNVNQKEAFPHMSVFDCDKGMREQVDKHELFKQEEVFSQTSKIEIVNGLTYALKQPKVQSRKDNDNVKSKEPLKEVSFSVYNSQSIANYIALKKGVNEQEQSVNEPRIRMTGKGNLAIYGIQYIAGEKYVSKSVIAAGKINLDKNGNVSKNQMKVAKQIYYERLVEKIQDRHPEYFVNIALTDENASRKISEIKSNQKVLNDNKLRKFDVNNPRSIVDFIAERISAASGKKIEIIEPEVKADGKIFVSKAPNIFKLDEEITARGNSKKGASREYFQQLHDYASDNFKSIFSKLNIELFDSKLVEAKSSIGVLDELINHINQPENSNDNYNLLKGYLESSGYKPDDVIKWNKKQETIDKKRRFKIGCTITLKPDTPLNPSEKPLIIYNDKYDQKDFGEFNERKNQVASKMMGLVKERLSDLHQDLSSKLSL